MSTVNTTHGGPSVAGEPIARDDARALLGQAMGYVQHNAPDLPFVRHLVFELWALRKLLAPAARSAPAAV